MSVIQVIFNFFYEIFFGCSHNKLTRPFTLESQTYKVCLDCGKQIYYSPITLQPLSVREIRRMKAVEASEVKLMPSAPAMVRTSESKSNAA
jgi:hypothetical protein